MKVRRRIRQAVAAILYYSGIVPVLLRRRLRRRAVALMYHRVLPGEALDRCPSHPAIVVSLPTFERHVDWIRRVLRPAPLSAIEQRLAAGAQFEDRTCLVTFDDGWADNFEFAAPVLKRSNVPAAVFLSTGFVGTRDRFWQERIVVAFTRIREEVGSNPAMRARVRSDPVLSQSAWLLDSPPADFRDALTRFVSSLKSRPTSEVHALVEAGEAAAGGAAELARPDFLDWDRVASMAGAGFEFGAHGVRHRILTRPETDVEGEVRGSRDVLRERLGRVPSAFCYPNGDHDGRVVEIVRRSGFALAFTTRPGYISADSDPYTLPRISIHEGVCPTIPLLAGRIAGLW